MITRRESTRSRRSSGFTLVELLVVFAIIAILAALTVTAVFKVIGVQQGNNTQLTIKSVSSLLNKHWTTVVKDHQNDLIPQSVIAIAGNDPRRARVIWIKLNLKREFPMNLTEAITPSIVGVPNGPISTSDLPAKPGYQAALQRAAQIQGAVFTASTSPTVWPFESAFTLPMALQQNRGGIAFAEENFAANALATELFTWTVGPPPQRSQNPFMVGPKALVDAWGTPLVFYRWPIGNTDIQGNIMNGTVVNPSFPDPLDPEGTLVDPRWNNFANWSSGPAAGVWWFEKYCHSIHQGSTLGQYKPFACYSEPVVVSAGPDHILGITPTNTSPSLPDEMSVNPSTAGAWNDNISSYSLRLGGTGDK